MDNILACRRCGEPVNERMVEASGLMLRSIVRRIVVEDPEQWLADHSPRCAPCMEDFRDLLPHQAAKEEIPFATLVESGPLQPGFWPDIGRVLLGLFWTLGWAGGWLAMVLPVRLWLFYLGLLVAIACPAFAMRTLFGKGGGAMLATIGAWIFLGFILFARLLALGRF